MKTCKNCHYYGQSKRGEDVCYKRYEYIKEDVNEHSCKDFDFTADYKLLLAVIAMIAFIILSILGIL